MSPFARRLFVVLAAAALTLALTAAAASAQAPACTINGTPGDDVLNGTPGVDVICGGEGNDQLAGAGGNDILRGEGGNDRFLAGPGADTMEGGDGNDFADYGLRTNPVVVSIGDGANDGATGEHDDVQGDVERLGGGDGADTLTGDALSNLLWGRGGDDQLNGGDGDDELTGGPGADTFSGGDGKDQVDYKSATGPVTVTIGDGADDGTDGENDDVQADVERIGGGPDNDHLVGDGSANWLWGRGGDDALVGAGGDDQMIGGDGADSFDGGAGDDRVDYSAKTDPVTATIGGGANDGTSGEGDDIHSDVETVYGGQDDDDLTGDASANVLNGREGNDTVTGMGGGDRLVGAAGDDDLTGGGAVDEAIGGIGSDTIHINGDGATVDEAICGPDHDFVFADAADTLDADCENQPPDTQSDGVNVGEDDGAAAVDVLGNDSDPEGRALSVASIDTTGTVGSATLSAGTVSYDPNGQFEALKAGATSSDSFSYQASDGIDTSPDTSVTVTVTGANDAPHAADDSGSTDEDTTLTGSAPGVLSNDTDVDSGDTKTVVELNGSGTLSGTTGKGASVSINADGSYSYNPAGQFDALASGTSDTDSFNYTMQDGSGAQSTATVTVTITGADDTPTDIALSSQSVDENQPSGTNVGSFSTTDQDAGDIFTYSLVSGTGSGDNSAFQITGSTLQTSQSFNFEAKNSYSIRVRSADSGNQSTEKQFTITITNANDAPTDIALSNASVAENQPSGTTVGTFSTTDEDAGDTFSYALVSGTGSGDNGAFQISGSTLQTSQSFNFEAKSSYSIRVRSTDSGNQNTEKQFTVTIANANDAPTDIALGNAIVDENQPSGTTVGTFSTTDEDAGDTFTYALVSGTGSGDNGAFQITGNTLKTNQSFNFEAKSSYSIRVRSTDSGNQNTEKQFTIAINDINDPPVPGTDSASAVGNTLLAWGGTASVPAGQAGKDVTTGNVLSNDTDEDAGQTLSMDLAGSSTTTPNGGTVAWFADGSFRYTPAAGFTGSDTLTYKVTDGQASVAGTVTVAVANKVWYVKNNQAAGGNGRSSEPFDTLAEAQNASAAGEDIYVFKGDGTTTGQNAGITLKSNQRLLGEAVTLIVGGDTLYTGVTANRPAISGNPGVKLATGSRVEGLDVAGSGGPAVCAGTAAPCSAAAAANGSTVTNVNLTGNTGGFNLAGGTGTFSLSNFSVTTTGGTGLRANNAGTLSVPSPPPTTIASTGGPAVDIQSTGGSVVLDSASSTNSATAGINLDSNGTGTFSAAAGSITGAAGNAVDINAGNGDITYAGTLGNGTGNTADITGRTGGAILLSGNINDTNDAGGGITMSGNTGGSTTFSGTAKTLNTGASAAFSSTGSGHTINLTGGGLDIDTTSGGGLSATGGGTINVTTGTNPNTIDSTTGTALNVTSTTIGGSGLTFRSISATGGANGIVLNNTGSSGGLTVTGDGTNTSVGGNASGGTIGGMTGADGTTAGIGVYLINTQSVTLRRMTLNGTKQNFGIYGSNVNGLTVEFSTVGGTNGTSTGADEGSIIFDGLVGTSTFSKDAVSGSIEDNFRMRNSSGTSTVTIDSSTFTNAPNDNVILEPSGTSTVTAHVTTNTFTGAGGDHFQTATSNSATLNVVFTGNFFTNGFPNSLGGGITISGGNLNPTSTEHVNFNISNNGSAANPLVGTVQGGAININEGNGNGVWQGQVSNNFIGNSAVVGSGCAQCSGIRVENHSPSGTLSAIVSGNTIRQWSNGPAINSQAGDAGNASNAAKLNLTVTSNTAANPGANSQHGFVANIGAAGAGDASVACTDVRSNTLDGNATTGGVGVRLRQRNSSTIKIPGYTGGQYDITAVAAFEVTQNPGNTANAATSSTGPGFTNTSPAGSACPQPTVPQ